MDTPDVQSDQVDEEPDARLILPGQRIDFLVKAGEPGTYELVALPYDQGYPSPTGLVALVEVAGEPLPMALPAALPKPPLEPIRDDEITGSRQLTFSAISPEVDAAGHWREVRFMIDGKTFDMNRIDQRVRLGMCWRQTYSPTFLLLMLRLERSRILSRNFAGV
jgi:FtsP/CotA-like multicopper oxidase with cupredoxin domain